MNQDGNIGKPWTHILPQSRQTYSCMWSNSLRKIAGQLLQIGKGRTGQAEADRRGWEAASPLTTPGTVAHNREGTINPRASLWGAKGLYPMQGTPTLKACTWVTGPQNTWLWKLTGLASMRPKGLKQMEKLLLKCLCRNSLTPEPWAKAAPWKAARLDV